MYQNTVPKYIYLFYVEMQNLQVQESQVSCNCYSIYSGVSPHLLFDTHK